MNRLYSTSITNPTPQLGFSETQVELANVPNSVKIKKMKNPLNISNLNFKLLINFEMP